MGRQNPKPKKKNKYYRISLVENDTHKSVLSLKFSKPGIILVIVSSILLFIAIIYSLVAFTPIRKSIPGYPNAHSMRDAVENAIKIDSLESAITRWELYSENLSRVLAEEATVSYDSIIRGNPIRLLSDKPVSELNRADSLLRESIVKEEQFELSAISKRNLPIEGMHFFTPLKGVITTPFDRVIHPALDIKAPKNTVVNAIYEGTVIFAGWDDERGNVIIIQHPDNVISIYEHGEKLLKAVGDNVTAGTPIALVGSTGALTKEEHLHFALWYDGQAQDPTRFISF